MWCSPASGLSLTPCQRGCVLEKPANCKQYVGLISLQLILAPCMGETSLGRELCSAPLFPSCLQRAPTGLHQGPAPTPTPGGSRAGQAPPGVCPCHSCSPLTLITLCRAPPCPQTSPEMPMHNPGEQLVSFLGKGLEAGVAGCHHPHLVSAYAALHCRSQPGSAASGCSFSAPGH